MSFASLIIFNGRSLRKLNAVPKEVLPKPKLQNKLVQYIISLSEKGAIFESVAFDPQVEGG